MDVIPVVVMVKGDFLRHLTGLPADFTMKQVAEHATHIAMGRVERFLPDGPMAVKKRGNAEPFAADLKVKDSGLAPMDWVEVYPA